MNSRERLLNALAGKPVDRVPISTYELVGYNSRSFENIDPSYRRLMDAIRERTDCVCMWDPASNAVCFESSHPAELETVETREGDSRIFGCTLQTPSGPLTSTRKINDGIHTVWQVEHWCKSPEDVDRALSIPNQPLDYDVSDLARIENEMGDRGIVMTTLGDPLLYAAELMEFGAFTIWAMMETEHFARVIEILHERIMENLRHQLAVNRADLYRICGPEYATPPYLPPSFFERFVTPYVREMSELIHSHGARVRLHSHGRIGKVLDFIARTGVDALDPCEAPPDGDIELGQVKQKIGDRICLFGNIQLKLLECGTPEQVRQAVKRCMEQAKAGGRYVLMPTAAPINTPLAKQTEANYFHYIEAAEEFGRY